MARKNLSFENLPQISVAAGATTPNPGIVGVLAWSTLLGDVVKWNGSTWELSVSAASAATKTLQHMLDSVARSFWNNPRTRRPMANPPTITVGTSSVPSGFVQSYVFGDAGAPFVHGGGIPSTTSGVTTFPVCTVSGTTKEQVYWRVSTILDGDEISFLLSSATANGYRFLVDDQYVSMDGTVSAAGANRYYTLTFPTRDRRKITVEGQGSLVFAQARVKFTDSLLRPSVGPKVHFVTDSNGTASGESYDGDGLIPVIADRFGVLDMQAGAAFGTGFIATDSGTKNNYASRRADWTTTSPDMVVFFMSSNDWALTPTNAAMKSAIATELIQARSSLGPNVPILVLADTLNSREIIIANGFLTTVQGYETAAAEAVSERNDPWMKFVPAINQSEPLAVRGVDITDSNFLAIYNNGTNHLNAEGYKWWGTYLSLKIAKALAEMAGATLPSFAPKNIPQEIAVGATAPSSPYIGQLWLDTSGA